MHDGFMSALCFTGMFLLFCLVLSLVVHMVVFLYSSNRVS